MEHTRIAYRDLYEAAHFEKPSWYDRKSGQVIQHEVHHDENRYIELPRFDDTTDQQMRVEFTHTLQDRPALQDRIGEIFAYNRPVEEFEELLQQEGLLHDWKNYRELARQRLLNEWCSNHGIRFDMDGI
ncbi:UPF0158 family protein [Bhargavaea cecembensis]|uniref:UPF0158 family protein n=1 Tax=Bhargavaea cecembensis TaxID=394098 RepID=UPI0005900653|nr:UPF0158 family protein [Bhargavaea cecembensis]